jgi:hypothetical protein
MGELDRYTPIVAIATASASGRIATAWKDGRVALWRLGAAPRLGAWGAMPLPSFEEIARFDHGREFGLQGTWLELPSLFVSDSGRLLASQSLSLGANAFGVSIGAEPLLRIWDVQQKAERARLHGGSPRLVAFSPDDRVMATLEAAGPAEPAGDRPAPRLEIRLWDVAPPRQEAAPAETGPVTRIPMLPAQPGSKVLAPLLATLSETLGSGAFWVGADMKLWFRDPEGGVIELEDLRPLVAARVARIARARVTGSGDAVEADKEAVGERAREMLAMLDKQFAMLPPAFPVSGLTGVVSGDGRRAALGILGTVRLYALNGAPRLLRSIDLRAHSGPAEPLLAGLALSRGGERIAVSFVSGALQPTGADEATDRRRPDRDIRATLLVFRADGDVPERQRAAPAFVTPLLPRATEEPLAVSADGRYLVVDATLPPSGTGRSALTARTVVLDLQQNTEVLGLNERLLAPSPTGWEVDGGGTPFAAFDPTGTRLAIAREEPACGMVTEVTPALLTIRVPDCAERLIRLSLWDLRDRRRVLQVTTPGSANAVSPAMMQGSMMLATATAQFGVAPAPPMRLDLPEPTRAVFTSEVGRLRTEGTDNVLEITPLRRSVTLRQDETTVRAACARVSREALPATPAAWAAKLPNEAFRKLCLDGAVPATSR